MCLTHRGRSPKTKGPQGAQDTATLKNNQRSSAMPDSQGVKSEDNEPQGAQSKATTTPRMNVVRVLLRMGKLR